MRQTKENHEMERDKALFLISQINSLTIAASFQRAQIYSGLATDEERAKVRLGLVQLLDRLGSEFARQPWGDDVHTSKVEGIAREMSESYGNYLLEGRFRIGIAQKALNLYLKYLWCMGWVDEPPHCPFDSIVIGRLHGCSNIRFTRVDQTEQYGTLVEAAHDAAGEKSLPRWELETYNESTWRGEPSPTLLNVIAS